ncbi:beta-ketoacyl synthase N-terminal-like domain-containing protein [Flavobacterium lindanitolerans]|uniref:3-oxoacyl-(Acyl-carrier-protein) synthase n=1 Tax=Flavobacterium lindanitolerans TaxID=428988 RepID=A0A497VA40_9FLAO|nr:beta-ketoacyl synthase N-terminal-like domain-containing protein [Flavobacterium lindanitolerans]MBL7868411.1 beta-ketoacyl synthase [Flavobacterium lindanitolerans]PKW28712.1 3-oxoacyl-(acyl-carrier-protein) synthase [Flavobacterium lindanitolerans]RLJ35784.1 3-oxoacyl-(acyl-carrier-protein) synthase [Flavobacterium lindanitolerans]
MSQKIAITSLSSISPLGNSPEQIWQNYLNGATSISEYPIGNTKALAAMLPGYLKNEIAKLRDSESKYKNLDESVLYAIMASRKAIENAGWKQGDDFGINIGSSRGATQLFEKHFQEFLETGKTHTLASPTTTLGNISSWVAHDLNSKGPEISHSITCSTALHAVLNGIAWLRSGMADKFLVGGSEAPLTPFTIAQMNALKIYSKSQDEFPCRAFDREKNQNSMVLGEGASVACLETGERQNALAYIEGVGYATEILEHSISISAEAQCFQKSMAMALGTTAIKDVDAIVMHAPGTIKGDSSELKAIELLFGDHLPMLTTNKWKIGHTFGASGMLSIEMALLMMQHQKFIAVPFAENQKEKKAIRKVLVNAVGFGGNAVSILLAKP